MFRDFFKKKGLLSLFFAFSLFGIAADQPTSPVVKQESLQNTTLSETISALIEKRLSLAKELSTYKWNAKEPIDQIQEEEAFLEQMENKALPKSSDAKLIKGFFAAQIEASKMVNMEQFEEWVKAGVDKHAYAPEKSNLEKQIEMIDQALLNVLIENQKAIEQSKGDLKDFLAKKLLASGYSRDVIDSATHF